MAPSADAYGRASAQIARWRSRLPADVVARLETGDFAKRMVASGQYDWAVPNFRLQALQTRTMGPYPPNDREYVKQRWHYEAINLPAAAAAVQGVDLSASPAPIVAVVDTGIVGDHPDLAEEVGVGEASHHPRHDDRARELDFDAQAFAARRDELGAHAAVLRRADLVHHEQRCEGLGAVLEGLRGGRVDRAHQRDQLPRRVQPAPASALAQAPDRRRHVGAAGGLAQRTVEGGPEEVLRVLDRRGLGRRDDEAPPGQQEMTLSGAVVAVDRRPVVVIGPPLRGDRFVAADSCCDATRHTRAALPVNGGVQIAQRYAVDWEQLDEASRIYVGPREQPKSYTIYGKEALAVARSRGVKLGNPQGAAALRRAGKGGAPLRAAIAMNADRHAQDLAPVVPYAIALGVIYLVRLLMIRRSSRAVRAPVVRTADEARTL